MPLICLWKHGAMKRIKVDRKKETEGTLIDLFVFGGFFKSARTSEEILIAFKKCAPPLSLHFSLIIKEKIY